MDDEIIKKLLDSIKDAFTEVEKSSDSIITLMASIKLHATMLGSLVDDLKEHLELY